MILRKETERIELTRKNGYLINEALKLVFEIVDCTEDEYTVIYNCANMFIRRNPVTNEWWLLDSDRTPFIVAMNYYRPVYCGKHKWMCHTIGKNGCASLIKSALWYDGRMTEEQRDGNEFVWGDYPSLCSGQKLTFDMTKMSLPEDWKKFIVVSPPLERFARWVNWVLKNRYNKYYSFDLPKDKFLDEVVWSYPLVTSHFLKCDPHALSQETFIERIVQMYYGGDRERFNREVERVELKDLKEFYLDTFKEPLILNNVSRPEERVYSAKDIEDKGLEWII